MRLRQLISRRQDFALAACADVCSMIQCPLRAAAPDADCASVRYSSADAMLPQPTAAAVVYDALRCCAAADARQLFHAAPCYARYSRCQPYRGALFFAAHMPLRAYVLCLAFTAVLQPYADEAPSYADADAIRLIYASYA